MTNNIKKLNKLKDSERRALVASAAVLAMVLGTWGWLLCLALWLLGFLAVQSMGLSVPAWVGWFALVGLPVGAYLEVKYTG